MRNIILAAAMGTLAVATPAMAQDETDAFTGARVGVELGVVDDDIFGTSEATYGINAGYDFDLGGAVVGVTGTYIDTFDNDNFGARELGIGGRVGAKVSPRTLAYATAGYSNLDANGFPGAIDGVKVGLGLEQSFGNLYANIETRYGNYEAGLELYQTAIGFGIRF